MIKKRTSYCEPEKNVTAKGNSKQNNETKTMKQTPCIRGTERRPIWQKCNMARHCALTYIFSFILPYKHETDSIIPIL